MMKITEYINSYLSYLEFNLGRSENTITKYRGLLNKLQEDFEDPLSISTDDLERYCGIEQHKKGYSIQSRRITVSILRGFYTWLFNKKIICDNPTKTLPSPKIAKKHPRGMQLTYAGKLMRAPDVFTFIGVRDSAILSALMGIGLRVSELCNLNESDLIFYSDEGKSRLAFHIKGKGGKERKIPAPSETWAFIRAYLSHPDLASINRLLPNGDKVLFVSTRNRMVTMDQFYGERRRITPRSIARIISNYGEKAGIPRAECHPHALRHLFATELAEGGVDILQIQEAMGHASPETSKIYIQLAMKRRFKNIDSHSPLRKIETPVSGIIEQLQSKT